MSYIAQSNTARVVFAKADKAPRADNFHVFAIVLSLVLLAAGLASAYALSDTASLVSTAAF